MTAGTQIPAEMIALAVDMEAPSPKNQGLWLRGLVQCARVPPPLPDRETGKQVAIGEAHERRLRQDFAVGQDNPEI